MITYLDGLEQIAPMSDIETHNTRIENKNYTAQEWQKIYEAAKDYYAGLDIKWYWHLCDHEDKPNGLGCKVQNIF